MKFLFLYRFKFLFFLGGGDVIGKKNGTLKFSQFSHSTWFAAIEPRLPSVEINHLKENLHQIIWALIKEPFQPVILKILGLIPVH